MKLKEIGIGAYRCFPQEPQGLSEIGSVNLIIGRNNSGKSRLLDLIRYICDPKSVQLFQPAFISVVGELEHEDIARHFPQNQSNSEIGVYWQYGRRFIGNVIKYKFLGGNILSIDVGGMDIPPSAANMFRALAANIKLELSGKHFVHIAAERSIRPEPASSSWILADGSGATAVVQRYLNNVNLPSDVIEDELLSELNRIFEPDNRFTRILVQQHENSTWEIYLEERGKGRVPLSASGSGLQTVLLILLNLYTLPKGQNNDRGNLVVAIEEPENNLHPALQRRLLSSLHKYAVEHGAKFFITTHSTVAIDQFVGQKSARLYHVRHDGRFARVSAVSAYADGHEILRDLDVRASDLLQSNGIIWVEGPTDRIYINKWIELATDGKIREGTHYQCVFYGGKLLSHLSASGDLSVRKELIDLITVNKNAAIVIDSDRKSEMGRLNATKSRIKREFEEIGAMVWVTKGKEIENYISPNILNGLFGTTKPPGKLESVSDWIAADSKRKKMTPDKVVLAFRVTERSDCSSLAVLDLKEQVDRLISKIKRWNNLESN